MERRAKIPLPPASSIPIRPIAGEAIHTSSSSSSSPISSPDFIRQFHAAFKRHRPLSGTMQSNFSRASRVLVSQPDQSKSAAASSSSAGNNVGKRSSHAGAPVGVARLPNVVLDRRKDVAKNHPEDSSLTPPSITGTITTARDENVSPFERKSGDSEVGDDLNKASMGDPSSRLPIGGSASLDFRKEKGHLSHPVSAVSDNNPNHGYLQSIENFDPGMKLGAASLLERRDELRHNQNYGDPATRSSVMGSSCATTMSVHSGPTFQCTRAPLAGNTSAATQMSTSAAERSLGIQEHALSEGRGTVQKEGDGDHQQAPHMGEDAKEKVVSGNANCLSSQVAMTNNQNSNVGVEPRKTEKVPRKKKYDPDMFFKVNGKLCQKLGKIGSGGSNEVHNVISSDCTIYVMKKIKLKGHDYLTDYGIFQEIEYLNKLRGKNNIIQLIDYEVRIECHDQFIKNFHCRSQARIKEERERYRSLSILTGKTITLEVESLDSQFPG